MDWNVWGVAILNENTGIGEYCNKAFGLPAECSVFSIIQDINGIVWLSAKNMLVKISERKVAKHVFFSADIFKSKEIQSKITCLYIDGQQKIWLGTHSSGIFSFDPATQQFTSYGYSEIGWLNTIKEIRTIISLSKDSLLIGGMQTGLVLLHTNTGRFEKISIDHNDLKTVAPTINVFYRTGNILWIGTEENGLWKTDLHLRTVTPEPFSGEVPATAINSIEADKQNNLWLLTNAGLMKFSISHKKVVLFNDKSGANNGIGLLSIIIDQNDIINIGSVGSIYTIDASGIIDNTKPPLTCITGFKVFDKEYNLQKGKPVELNYDENYFSLDFVALNFTQPYLNRYAYKMDGLDKQWINAGTRRYVSYANLGEGTYSFYVKGCNNEGVWNNVPAKLTIIIQPPFWHRWWFYLLCAVFVISSVYAFYRYNLNQLKLRERLRDKIARDLHDDIGSTLTSISYNSEVVKMQLKDEDASLKIILDKIGASSRNIISGMSDIVWLINPQNDTTSALINQMKRYAAEMLNERNIQYRFNIQENEKLKLSMQQRKNIYLIYKEAIHNAVKYAECSYIETHFIETGRVVRLEVKDNGKGFTIKEVECGNGLTNMTKRAKEIKAAISIESIKEEGTSVHLICKIT